MKQAYINAVKNSKAIDRAKKAEIIRDLEEIFAEGLAHGEDEAAISSRLGDPAQFASAVAFGITALLVAYVQFAVVRPSRGK